MQVATPRRPSAVLEFDGSTATVRRWTRGSVVVEHTKQRPNETNAHYRQRTRFVYTILDTYAKGAQFHDAELS